MSTSSNLLRGLLAARLKESAAAAAAAAVRPELSFDGCGINGPDEYRTRLATFDRARWDTEQTKHYGRLFAAAPELLTALRACIAHPMVAVAMSQAGLHDQARAAIAKAEGAQ